MKLKESKIRQIIREELLKEIHPWNDDPGPDDVSWEEQMRDVWRKLPRARVAYMDMGSGAAPAPIYSLVDGKIKQTGEISTEEHLNLSEWFSEGKYNLYYGLLDDYDVDYLAFSEGPIEKVNDTRSYYSGESSHWANELGDQLGVREPSSMPWDD